VRSTYRLEKLLLGLKKAVFPGRYKEESGKIYGFSGNEWQEMTDEDLENLKASFKSQHIENLKAFRESEIEVTIISGDEEAEKPLRKWPDGFCLYPDGFKHVINVDIGPLK
jgi:hypothetical protein